MEKYFDVTAFFRENFHYRVNSTQFKNFIKGLIECGADEQRRELLLNTGEGRFKKTLVNPLLIPLVAKWIETKEPKEGNDVKEMMNRLLFDDDFKNEYLVEIGDKSEDEKQEN